MSRELRTPITLGARTYHGPMTTEALTAWFDQLLEDQTRCLGTNLQLAFDAGEVADVDDIDDVLAEARRVAAESREQFQYLLVALMDAD